MNKMEQVISMASIREMTRVALPKALELCEGVSELIDELESHQLATDDQRKLARILDAIGELRFEQWEEISPFRKADKRNHFDA